MGFPWTPEPSNWRLYIHKPGTEPHATLQKPGQGSSPIRLVDIRSSTFGTVSSILSPLESPEHVIATHTPQSLEVSLPRFHLSFFVNMNGELESRSMPNYVIDGTQSCGTMFGLRNKLVLCPRRNSSEKSFLPRRVIIPQGKVSFCTTGDFTDISINTGAEQHVRWHEYTIDTDLGRLTSNTSLTSKLFQCYLHALTSHCLPDPLLGHTGTEEALCMLRSATCRSFQRLDGNDAKLLKSICDLTPDRVYYPPHLKSMAAVKWNDLPALSQHHDFFEAVCAILDHARALEALYDQPTTFDSRDCDQSLLNRAASRNMIYYPLDLQISEKPSSLDDVKYRSRDVLDHETSKHVAYQTSWSIWNAQPLPFYRTLPKLWDLKRSRGSAVPSSGEISLRYSRYWLDFDAAQDWFVIYNIYRYVINGGLPRIRIGLSFCLSAAAYRKSEYSDVIPFFMASALNERCRYLSPPAYPSYTLSDGVAPNQANLEDLVSQSALPMESIPAYSLKENTKKMAKKQRKKKMEYDADIRKESSLVASSILHQWPDYSSVNFPEQRFNESECYRSIDEYIQSMSRNVELRNHILQLHEILKSHGNVPTRIPATLPYTFLPQFITSRSKAPSYSIHDAMLSCANVPNQSTMQPFRGDSIPPAAATSSTLEPVGLDRLKTLIEEFRHSQQPLLGLYGNDLNKSYRKLIRRCVSNSAQCTHCAVPSHELLRLYHDECSLWKDEMFSEISATLGPSQNVENANAIAGLWPRITPRSLLRQLAQDRLGTLPDQWKVVITRYAVCLLDYQQSRRMLELSSSQKYEDLLREIDSMRSNVLAESTPDWLLVQVRPLLVRCRRSN